QRPPCSLGWNGCAVSAAPTTRYRRNGAVELSAMTPADGVAAEGEVMDGGSLAGNVSARASSSSRAAPAVSGCSLDMGISLGMLAAACTGAGRPAVIASLSIGCDPRPEPAMTDWRDLIRDVPDFPRP